MEESAGYRWIVRKGAKQELVATMVDLGGQKFGEPPPATLGAVQAIADLDRLRQLRSRVLAATSWEDLLGTP